MLNALTTERRAIILTDVLKKGNKSQKTSDNLSKLHANDCS